LAWTIVGVVLAGCAALIALFGLVRVDRAVRAATQGKRALLRAEADLADRDVQATRADLDQASAAFARVRHEIHALGPLRRIADTVPLVRVQLRAALAYADAGDVLTKGARDITDAAAEVIDPPNPRLRLSRSLDALRRIRMALEAGIADLDTANTRMLALNGERLFGPLDSTRRQLARELPRARQRAQKADEGVAALIDFVGGAGPRRYLVFSQNPDEPRPTGGFIGSYGLISAMSGHVTLERYASIESWYLVHPETDVPADKAPTAFRVSIPAVHQTLANVNAVADWPTAGRLAATMWQRAGEAPVDGAMSVTPEFLARVLGVLGPVRVPGYPDRVTESNVIGRIDYYTHVEVVAPGTNRKQFLVALARVVVAKLLDAPASTWDPLGRQVAAAFDAREAMAWSSDSVMQTALSDRRWDGTLPATAGDFFYDGEFAYATKNGRALRRTFEHVVTLAADGSGRVTTTVTIADVEPLSAFNIDSFSYLTFYGPTGATFVRSSKPAVASEPARAAHPAMGWALTAPALGTTTLTYTWSVPHLAVHVRGGTWSYQLWWMHLPAHTGDILHLHVRLPAGWRWDRGAPGSSWALDHDVVGNWAIDAGVPQ
jgi:Protein of unknown function (DUF4012)